jgi:hypothetical protein
MPRVLTYFRQIYDFGAIYEVLREYPYL